MEEKKNETKKVSSKSTSEKVTKAEVVETTEVKAEAGFDKKISIFAKKVGPVPVVALVAVAVLAVIIFAAIICCVASGSKNKVVKYPVVYVSDDKLFVGTKNGKTNRVDSDYEKYSADIIYKNNKTDEFLYLSDDTLFEVKSKNGEKEKIASDVKSALYSDDDKYIVYLDDESNLYSYKRSSNKIAKNVSRVYAVVGNKVYYGKGDSLYVTKITGTKDADKIDSDVSGFKITEDKKYAVYLKYEDGTYDIYRIKIGSKKSKKIVSGAKNVIDANDDFTAFIYTTEASKNTFDLDGILKDNLKEEDDEYMKRYEGSGYNAMSYSEKYKHYDVETRDKIRNYVSTEGIEIKSYDVYYAKNNKSTKLASNVNEVLATDVDAKTVLYVKQTLDKSKKLDIEDYTSYYKFEDDVEDLLTSDLYYSKNGKKEVSIAKNVTDINAYLSNGKVFYVEKVKGDYKLKFAKIFLGKASVKEIADDIDSKYLTEYKDGFIYGTNKNSKHYTMDLNYVNAKGKTKTIATDISASKSPILSNNEKKLYFYQNYDDGEGDLVVYNGSRVKTVMENISKVYYVGDKFMYVLSDCDSKSQCDLSIYKGSKKLKKIASDVTDVVSYR